MIEIGTKQNRNADMKDEKQTNCHRSARCRSLWNSNVIEELFRWHRRKKSENSIRSASFGRKLSSLFKADFPKQSLDVDRRLWRRRGGDFSLSSHWSAEHVDGLFTPLFTSTLDVEICWSTWTGYQCAQLPAQASTSEIIDSALYARSFCLVRHRQSNEQESGLSRRIQRILHFSFVTIASLQSNLPESTR